MLSHSAISDEVLLPVQQKFTSNKYKYFKLVMPGIV